MRISVVVDFGLVSFAAELTAEDGTGMKITVEAEFILAENHRHEPFAVLVNIQGATVGLLRSYDGRR